MAEMNLTLDADAIEVINVALIYGLKAYGELERLQNAAEIRKMIGDDLDDSMIPIDVNADPVAITVFADAIGYMRQAS